MNESGISLVETLLTLAILMLLCGSLIPLHSHLNQTLHESKLELHASEVAYQGAQQVAAGGVKEGTLTIDGVLYHWEYQDSSICVTFPNVEGAKQKCISEQGEKF